LKKIGLLTLLIFATLLFTLAFTAAAAGPKAPAAPLPALAAVPAAAATPDADDHPHIHEALEAMRNAKKHLETAAHDFHGHRVKAIEHLNQAIHEAEICENEK
jgi:Skp family chaperone for outer membrane proteins